MQDNRQPKVSVILPLYKNEEYLTQCIDSVVNQTLKEIEIILCDKNKSKRVREIIDYYADKDSRVKILSNEEDNGEGASLNRGIRAATGEYIAFVETDDFVDPEMYEELYNYAKKMGDVDVVKSSFWEYRDNCERREYIFSSWWKRQMPHDKTFTIKQFPCLLTVNTSIWAALYRKNFIMEKNIRFIEADGAGYVDKVWRVNILTKAASITWLNKPFYNYRLTNPNASVKNYDIITLLTRSKDVHEIIPVENKDSFGEYLFTNDFFEVFSPIRLKQMATKQQIAYAKEIMNYYSEEMIKNAPIISEKDKDFALRLKRDFYGTFEQIKFDGTVEQIKQETSKSFLSRIKKLLQKIIKYDLCSKTLYPGILFSVMTMAINPGWLKSVFLMISLGFVGLYGCGLALKVTRKVYHYTKRI